MEIREFENSEMGIWDWRLGFGIGDGIWKWEQGIQEFGIGDRNLGSGIWDWEFRDEPAMWECNRNLGFEAGIWE